MSVPERQSLQERTAFVCLLTGSKYDVEYVSLLYRSVRRNCATELPFVCLTDQPALVRDLDLDISVIPLADPLPGWWSKVRLFDVPTPFRHLVYVDLDVVILKSIDHLLDHIGRADLVHAQDLLDDMSSSFMIIDTESVLAKDVVEQFDLAEWSAPDVNDQHYFQRLLRRARYTTMPLPWPDHYSYKYLIDHGDWRARTTNRNIEVVPLDRITMLNLHGHPKPHHIREAPEHWLHSDVILRNWR